LSTLPSFECTWMRLQCGAVLRSAFIQYPFHLFRNEFNHSSLQICSVLLTFNIWRETRTREKIQEMTTSKTLDYEFEYFKKASSHDAYPIAEQWMQRLLDIPMLKYGEVSGALRRGKASISQIDLALACDNPDNAIREMAGSFEFEQVLDQDNDHLLLMLTNGMKLAIWLALPAQFPFQLLRTTGSAKHLNQLARQAAERGLQFNSSGFWKDGRLMEFESEEQIYATLGLPFIPPELRESGEEIARALHADLNHLINIADIQADLHVHTTWSDGRNSIEEMAEAGIARGLKCIAICDHSPLLIKRNQDASYLFEQARAIDALRMKMNGRLTILKGVEVDILPDGSLDLPDQSLQSFDIVVASMHVELEQPQQQATARLIRAIENPTVNIIGHPGGRTFPSLDVTDLDWERIYRAAVFNHVALEINSHKSHPIFDDQKARTAAEIGVQITLNSDSHDTRMLNNTRYGLAIARRAGLTSGQVINTWSASHLKLWLQKKREANAKGR